MANYIQELENELTAERENANKARTVISTLEATIEDLNYQLRAAQSINRTMMKYRNNSGNAFHRSNWLSKITAATEMCGPQFASFHQGVDQWFSEVQDLLDLVQG